MYKEMQDTRIKRKMFARFHYLCYWLVEYINGETKCRPEGLSYIVETKREKVSTVYCVNM